MKGKKERKAKEVNGEERRKVEEEEERKQEQSQRKKVNEEENDQGTGRPVQPSLRSEKECHKRTMQPAQRHDCTDVQR